MWLKDDRFGDELFNINLIIEKHFMELKKLCRLNIRFIQKFSSARINKKYDSIYLLEMCISAVHVFSSSFLLSDLCNI